jgi:MAP kinase interacting serine/threonine kinase
MCTHTRAGSSELMGVYRFCEGTTTYIQCVAELYSVSSDLLGRGAYASVRTCVSKLTDKQYAVKVIEKHPGHSRARVIKEIETFNLCKDHPNIVHLVEFFEETDKFYLIFEKMRGGPLLNHIQRRVYFTEQEAVLVTRDIANALKFLHDKGACFQCSLWIYFLFIHCRYCPS